MKRFHNTAFVLTQTALSSLIDQSLNSEVGVLDSEMHPSMLARFSELLRLSFSELLNDLTIPFTLAAVVRLQQELSNEGRKWTVRNIWERAHEINGRLYDELETRGSFFYIPIERAKTFDTQDPFGSKVMQKFPRLTEDISEAHKCFACGRFTACVFHLMRVMEHGVQRLGKKLGVKIDVEKETWQTILNHVNGKIKLMDHKKPKTAKIAAIGAHLYNVKVAWRNSVMHPKATYTQEEAENLLSQVGIFMDSLAKAI